MSRISLPGSIEERRVVFAGLALAMAISSTSAIIVRLSEAPSVVKVLYRLLFTTLLLAPVALGRYREHFARLSKRDLALAIAVGLVLAVHYTLFFESLVWTTVAAAVTLAQTQTIFVALGAALFLGERLTSGRVAGIAFGLGGVAVMTGLAGVSPGELARGARPLFGNALALAASALFAAYLLAGRSIRQRVALVPYLAVIYAAATVGTLAIAAVDGARIALWAYPPREWLLFLALAVGPTIVSQGLVNWSLAYVESGVVSVLFLSVPVASAALAVVLLGEHPGPATVVGGAMVLGGIYLTTRSTR